MTEVGGGLGLATEALDERPVGGELGEEDLQCDGPVEEGVARQVDVGHAATRDPAVELVAAPVDAGFLNIGHER